MWRNKGRGAEAEDVGAASRFVLMTRMLKPHDFAYIYKKGETKMKEFRKIFVPLHPNNINMSPVFRRESEYNSASTSASVLMINAQGIMLSVLDHDYFLSYNRIPWMQDAPIRSVLNVQMSGPEAIEWPDLDVDLEIESLQHPERYPLVIKRNALDFVGV